MLLWSVNGFCGGGGGRFGEIGSALGGCGGNGGGCSVPAELYETKPGTFDGGGAGVGRLPRPTSVRRPIMEQERTCRGWCGCCRGGEAEAEAEAADAKPAAFSASAAVGSASVAIFVWGVEETC